MKETYYIAPFLIDIVDFVEPISMGTFVIRRITTDERNKFFNVKSFEVKQDGRIEMEFNASQGPGNECLYDMYSPNEMESFRTDFKMKMCNFIIECNSCDEPEKVHKEFNNMIFAFRLYRSGFVCAPTLISFNRVAYSHPQYVRNNDNYKINTEEISEVKKIYDAVCLTTNRLLLDAFGEFNDCVDIKANIKKSFVGLVSIIELLFINGSNEISLRFSLLVSYKLSNILGYRVNFDEIKSMYKCRSDIAHEANSKLLTGELLGKLELYTRTLLIWYINNYNCKNYNKEEGLLEVRNKLNI
ncbi:MAG: hypothetical protein WCF94_02755 [bacterium]